MWLSLCLTEVPFCSILILFYVHDRKKSLMNRKFSPHHRDFISSSFLLLMTSGNSNWVAMYLQVKQDLGQSTSHLQVGWEGPPVILMVWRLGTSVTSNCVDLYEANRGDLLSSQCVCDVLCLAEWYGGDRHMCLLRQKTVGISGHMWQPCERTSNSNKISSSSKEVSRMQRAQRGSLLNQLAGIVIC